MKVRNAFSLGVVACWMSVACSETPTSPTRPTPGLAVVSTVASQESPVNGAITEPSARQWEQWAERNIAFVAEFNNSNILSGPLEVVWQGLIPPSRYDLTPGLIPPPYTARVTNRSLRNVLIKRLSFWNPVVDGRPFTTGFDPTLFTMISDPHLEGPDYLILRPGETRLVTVIFDPKVKNCGAIQLDLVWRYLDISDAIPNWNMIFYSLLSYPASCAPPPTPPQPPTPPTPPTPPPPPPPSDSCPTVTLHPREQAPVPNLVVRVRVENPTTKDLTWVAVNVKNPQRPPYKGSLPAVGGKINFENPGRQDWEITVTSYDRNGNTCTPVKGIFC